MFVYQNGVYYIDSLQNAIDSKIDDGSGKHSDELYISIPDEEWDDFANNFSIQVSNNKVDYKKKQSLYFYTVSSSWWSSNILYQWSSTKTTRRISNKIEEVEAQNMSNFRLEENEVKELNQLSTSYNKMLERLSSAFEVQRQFTANAAHELRTPLAVMQAELDLYNSIDHPTNDESAKETIKMVTEQNEKLSKMVKTLLDMSELQTVSRDDKILLNALVEEVLADLEPLAKEKNINLVDESKEVTMQGSDILIYRLVYNLVENAIKYNKQNGTVTVKVSELNKHIYLSVTDTGNGIPQELRERVFEPFFRLDKSRSRALGGVGLGLALVHEIVKVHDGSITIKDNPEGGTIFEIIF